MERITLIKIKEREDAYHPNNIEKGYEKIGFINSEPKIGELFYMSTNKMDGSYFRTSVVMEIIDKDTFKTMDSIYKIIRDNEPDLV